jgi:hypothetical protein
MAAKTTTPPEPRLDFWDTNEGALMLACWGRSTRREKALAGRHPPAREGPQVGRTTATRRNRSDTHESQRKDTTKGGRDPVATGPGPGSRGTR